MNGSPEPARRTPERGVDLGRLASWLRHHVDDDCGDLQAQVIAGGRSNLTYVLSTGETRWILRRPPLGHVLSTAHDMAREYRVMAALAGSGVPVPRTLALCEDLSVIGATFYVMEKVDGTPYRTAAELRDLGPDRTRTISQGLVETLARLHQIDPVAVGLADFGRPDGFLERQIRRWRQQLKRSYSRPLPGVDLLHDGLISRVPPPSAARIVHGDYRLDNVLVDDGDRPAAVIDWEMATLGDPLTDLALLLLYQRLASVIGDIVTDVPTAPGFLTEHQLIDHYVSITGGTLPNLDFYLGLAAYKLAGILEGIHFRYRQGQTVGAGFDKVGDAVQPVIDAGIAVTKEFS